MSWLPFGLMVVAWREIKEREGRSRDGDGTKERLSRSVMCGTRPHALSSFGCSVGCPEPLAAWPPDMPPTFLEKGARDQYEALVDKYDTWLFDCDGVLWNGDQPVDGAREVLEMLRKQSATAILSGYVTSAC